MSESQKADPEISSLTPIEIYKHKLKNIIDHYRNQHTKWCSHPVSFNPTYTPLDPQKDKETIEAIDQIIDSYIKLAPQYFHSKSSNICESLNSSIAQKVPKWKYKPNTYNWTVDLALGSRIQGPAFDSTILTKCDIPVSKRTIQCQVNRTIQKINQKIRKSSRIYKRKRIELKEKKKEKQKENRKKKQKERSLTYKGTCGCGKSTGEGCATRRCYCVKEKKFCVPECVCIGCQNTWGCRILKN